MALTGLAALSACLPIPHRHTQRAGARFHVTDENGTPIPSATVSVYGGNIIGGSIKRIATARTDSSGIATIHRDRSWHLIMILIPDAEAPSAFGWCAEAPGYAALGRVMEDNRRQELNVPLVRSKPDTNQCPERLDRYKLQQGQMVLPAA